MAGGSGAGVVTTGGGGEGATMMDGPGCTTGAGDCGAGTCAQRPSLTMGRHGTQVPAPLAATREEMKDGRADIGSRVCVRAPGLDGFSSFRMRI